MKFLAVLQYPSIDPFVFRWGKIGLSWYASSYLLGFILSYFILRSRIRKGSFKLPNAEDLWLLISYVFYGVVLGARIFYVLFYNLKYFVERPWEIPAIWHGGMSFHGGVIGLILATILFARRSGVPALHILDNISLCGPVALTFGRIANFINGELYGRVSDVPWAMVFPQGGTQPRHPSQLYESFLEGPVLFLIVFLTARRQPKDGTVGAVFLIGYGILRFFVEFFRQPDEQLGTILGPFSMGQLLCVAMIIAGLSVWIWVRRPQNKTSTF